MLLINMETFLRMHLIPVFNKFVACYNSLSFSVFLSVVMQLHYGSYPGVRLALYLFICLSVYSQVKANQN